MESNWVSGLSKFRVFGVNLTHAECDFWSGNSFSNVQCEPQANHKKLFSRRNRAAIQNIFHVKHRHFSSVENVKSHLVTRSQRRSEHVQDLRVDSRKKFQMAVTAVQMMFFSITKSPVRKRSKERRERSMVLYSPKMISSEIARPMAMLCWMPCPLEPLQKKKFLKYGWFPARKMRTNIIHMQNTLTLPRNSHTIQLIKSEYRRRTIT